MNQATIDHLPPIRQREQYSSAITNHSNVITYDSVQLSVLEMEDVLFHHNSALMLPDNRNGGSSSQGSNAPAGSAAASNQAQQVAEPGIEALALSFKQLEFDPAKRVLIAAHAHTSGSEQFNFKITFDRGKNVYALLIDSEESWLQSTQADTKPYRHKIEDYQHVLAWVSEKKNWNCDPQGIDNSWGPNTEKAIEAFLQRAKADHFFSGEIAPTMDKIRGHPNKLWPAEALAVIYRLYNEMLMRTLGADKPAMDARRSLFKQRIAIPNMPFIPCGEAFPIDAPQKQNYRSQQNRRVEVLFFDESEFDQSTSNELMQKCPLIKKQNVNGQQALNRYRDECPIWPFRRHFAPLYIDRNDLNAVVYHLKFVYYDRVLKRVTDVPAGLTIEVYMNGSLIPSESAWRNGVYYVKAKFQGPLPGAPPADFHFEFKTPKSWIFTDNANPGTVPRIIPDPAPATLIVANLAWSERIKYYDLPLEWSSRNYWTRDSAASVNGDRCSAYMAFHGIKPIGSALTSSTTPLVFSLDDIVLVDSAGKQALQDKDANNNLINLDDNSRYTLFHIDYDTLENVKGTMKNLRRMKIYKPEANQPVFTDVKFRENLIRDVPGFTRVVYFCNDFYDVTDKRTSASDADFDFTKNHICGARVARKNDTAVHHFQDFRESNASDKTNGYGYNATFHFELHYFHNCADLDGKTLHYLFIYWSCRLAEDIFLLGTAGDVTNHRKEGMVNAMDRMNKDYMIEKSSGSEDVLIRPFHFMEAKSDANGGKEKHAVAVTDDNHGSSNSPATSSYRAGCYKPEPGGWGGTEPQYDIIKDTDGKTYIPLANHHEMGHATGNFDDYLYDLKITNDAGNQQSVGIPRFSPQHIEGGPYSCDHISRMTKNRSSRIRNYWKYLCWLHDMNKAASGATPKGPVYDMLKGTRFKICYEGDLNGVSFKHNYEMSDTYKNTSIAAQSEIGKDLVTGAGTANEKKTKVDLLLYKLGDDQFSHFKNLGDLTVGYETTQQYHGLLVVRIKFAVKFDGAWTFLQKKTWLKKLDDDLGGMVNAKFYLECANNDFAKVFLYFVPHFVEFAGAAPADAHMKVSVGTSAGSTFNRPSNDSVTLDKGGVGAQQDGQIKRLIRCSLANSHGAADTGNLTRTDFPTIAGWLKSKLANVNVEIKDI
jgi:hypothetical protein